MFGTIHAVCWNHMVTSFSTRSQVFLVVFICPQLRRGVAFLPLLHIPSRTRATEKKASCHLMGEPRLIQSSWGRLLPDLAGLIVAKLDTRDVIRCLSVCKSWSAWTAHVKQIDLPSKCPAATLEVRIDLKRYNIIPC